MVCPSGQHQHIGADGKRMLSCHPITDKHTNPTAQNYHEMALQQGKGRESELVGGDEEYEAKDYITREQKERIKQNTVLIRRNLSKLLNNPRLKTLLVPISAGLMAYDGLTSTATKYKQKAKTEREKEMADIYSQTVEVIMDGMPDMGKAMKADDFVKLKAKYLGKVKELVKVIKENGKDCPEYAQYRAYKDFMALCDTKTMAILNRVDGGRTSERDKAMMMFGAEINGRHMMNRPFNGGSNK